MANRHHEVGRGAFSPLVIDREDGTDGNPTLSYSGRLLARNDWNNRSLKLLDLETGRIQQGPWFAKHGNARMDFSSDSTLLATCGMPGQARLWDFEESLAAGERK